MTLPTVRNSDNHIPTNKKPRPELMMIVLAVLSFTLVMVVIFLDAVGAINVSLWVLYPFLGLIALVVYGLMLVLHTADRSLGLPFDMMTMIYVVLTSAGFTFFGLARLGYISDLAPIVVLSAILLFLIARQNAGSRS